MYAQVVNGVVVNLFNSLPEVWQNVSGLDRLDAAELAAHGFLPVVESNPAYDPRLQRRTGTTTVLNGAQVDLTYQLEDLPLADVQNNAISNVNGQVAALLAPTDWYIARASEGYKATPAAVLTQRKTARDNGNSLVAQVQAAATPAAVVALNLTVSA